MTVRAKFQCESVTITETQQQVAFRPVCDDSPENKQWSKYTPSGALSLTITNAALLGHFKPGKQYYLDIIEVE